MHQSCEISYETETEKLSITEFLLNFNTKNGIWVSPNSVLYLKHIQESTLSEKMIEYH